MPDDSLFDLERSALARLQALVRDRAAAEAALADAHRAAADAADKEAQKARRQHAAARKRQTEELAAERAAAETELATRAHTGITAAQRRAAGAKADAEREHRDAEAALKAEYKERLWTIDSLHEASEKQEADHRTALVRKANEAGAKVDALWARAETALSAMKLGREDVEWPEHKLPPATPTDPVGKLEKCLEDADEAADRVAEAPLPKFVGLWGTVWCVFVCGAVAMAVAFFLHLNVVIALVIGVAGALAGGVGLRQLLFLLAHKQVRDRGTALGVFLAETARARDALVRHADQTHAARSADLKRKLAADRKRCDQQYRPQIAAVVKQSVTAIAQLDMASADQLTELHESHAADEQATTEHYTAAEAELTARLDAEARTIEDRSASQLAAAEAARAAAWEATSAAWRPGVEGVQRDCERLTAEANRTFPQWARSAGDAAPIAAEVPGGIRLGEYRVELDALPNGTAADPALRPDPPLDAAVPAFIPFPAKSAVLLKARDDGRAATVAALQALMLRFLTGVPPGKVRFTIVDPVGLGENFASFMHLADADELLVTSRIWTEPEHIERRLADLTEHMETVIQKYLRNQYKSIEEYNRAAGEVAEPYRVLVVANFPTNFTPDAAKRLVSIMSSGPACGVCTLVGVDTAAGMPRDFRLADLEEVAFNLTWKDGKFTPKDAAFAPFPLTVDAPPPAPDVARIVRRVGEASKLAARVEVPFEFIAAKPGEVWTGSTRTGFEVPIGRAGATGRQVFSLGKGTAQHAVVAGKTGSGKSTLLHALITNLALHYSPDEAELYLIDFKEGVEFKMYAEEKLPHARVVAIESEREFGLSVLQRLDAILRERGDLFRSAGVNDVAGFRDANPGTRLPRILLVVDEFQMLFVEDDKVAAEAAQLLDRLVRQGRAFGVHVLLGSQTLGGSYSLPRSTIDQMAVRIALQCSEADAQLILSKDNTAARLLTRPGEAIYNDANGRVEGNDPFQVVWLAEDRRRAYLDDLRARPGADRYPPPLVFEGSAAAEPEADRGIARAVAAPADALATLGPPTVWLGDSVAIKDATAAVFRPQSGANLLLIGQQDEAAAGILAAGLVALAARLRPTTTGRTLTVVDGTPDDSELADALRRTVAGLGLTNTIVERSGLTAAVADLAADVDRRTSGTSSERAPRFLFVNGLHRLRELRKAEDDFGFRRGEKVATPGEHFTAILRDGPAVGVHTVVWVDSLTSLTRALDRAILREFTLRVLFQMNPNDSSQLIDTVAASKLGRARALFTEDGMERPEKFRPYRLPGSDWVRGVGAALALKGDVESAPPPAAAVPMPVDDPQPV